MADLIPISIIITHFMGRSGPPGRRCAQRDARESGKDRPAYHFWAFRRAGPPHRSPGVLALSPRHGRLEVSHTTAAPVPNERTRDPGEMSDYDRDLVLGPR